MDELLEIVNVYVVDPLILGEVASTVHAKDAPWSEDYSRTRQFFVLWAFLYLSSMFVYVLFGGLTFTLFFVQRRQTNLDPGRKEHHAIPPANALTDNPAYWPWDNKQLRNELWVSTWSLFLMAGMTACVDLYFLLGGSRLYNSIDEYGWAYFLASPFLFLFFTDALIYWIHRILHWPSVYWLHKLHHKYKETTPWSAFSFHPLDGFAQSVPYHLFALFFPMHSRLYTATLMVVGLWTVNIHDRMTLRLWGVNGAAHHTVHHVAFNYNYGQYFTWSDHVFGTFKDPHVSWPYELDEAELEKNKQKEQAERRAAAGKQVQPIDDSPNVSPKQSNKKKQ